jgi:hypothetical protein
MPRFLSNYLEVFPTFFWRYSPNLGLGLPSWNCFTSVEVFRLVACISHLPALGTHLGQIQNPILPYGKGKYSKGREWRDTIPLLFPETQTTHMTYTQIVLLSCGSMKTCHPHGYVATGKHAVPAFPSDAAISRKASRGNPWDSSVGMATGYGLAGRCSIPDRIKKFSLLHSI